MAVTGIPDYSGAVPVQYSLRCVCHRRYLIFTGAQVGGDAESRARERATEIRAQFIDSQSTPFMNCECGQLLDFLSDESLIVM